MSASLTLPASSPSASSSSRADVLASPLVHTLTLWALYAIPLAVAVRPVGVPLYDPDVWWHLRVGQWVVEHRAVTSTDPFSLPGQTTPWVAYSWLYEVVLHGLFSAFGLAGIIVYRALFSLAIVAAVHALVCRLEKRFLVATGLTIVATLALTVLFSERPWLVTVLFSTLTLSAILALRSHESPPWWVWALPVLYCVWANVHIQFVYGLFLLGLGCIAPLFDQGLGRPDDATAATPRTRRWYGLVALAGACFLATLVNPYHVRLYGVVVEYARQPGPFRFVNELKALEFRGQADWIVLALTGAACWTLGRRKASAFEALLLVSTAWFSFRARRDLWFVILADLTILASAGSRLGWTEPVFRLGARGLAFIGAGLLLVVGGCVWFHDLSRAGLERRVAQVFPVEAARVIAERGYRGPLYNDFNWGGYLIWALPNMPVSIDGRTNLHGDDRILRFGQTWAGEPGWQDDPDLSQAGVVLAPADSALASLLMLDRRFERVHKDELAWVFAVRDIARRDR
jgi:hypothetical protein